MQKPRINSLLVVCLCADWCDTCRDYRAAFDALREEFRDHHFVWLDIENQADLVHEIEVENFPTLLVADKANVLFAGTMLPQIGRLRRLLTTFGQQPRLRASNLSAAEHAAYRSLATVLEGLTA